MSAGGVKWVEISIRIDQWKNSSRKSSITVYKRIMGAAMLYGLERAALTNRQEKKAEGG